MTKKPQDDRLDPSALHWGESTPAPADSAVAQFQMQKALEDMSERALTGMGKLLSSPRGEHKKIIQDVRTELEYVKTNTFK